MTNKQSVGRFEQAHGAKIATLFWIAGASDSLDLEDFIRDMDDRSLERCLPEIYKALSAGEYEERGDISGLLVNHQKFGLLAEIHIPRSSDFVFKKGKPSSWTVSEGICRIEYVYAETLEALLVEIENQAEVVFLEDVAKEQAKKK